MLERKVICEKCGEDYPPGWPHSCTESAPPAGYAAGDRVRILKDMRDDGEDHHPPGWYAQKGDIVTMIQAYKHSGVVNHDPTAKSGFYVDFDEIEAA